MRNLQNENTVQCKSFMKQYFERTTRTPELSAESAVQFGGFCCPQGQELPHGQLLVGDCLPQTLLDKSKGALSAPMLCLSFLLFQFKLTLLFCFALFTAKCFSHQLVYFSLHLQRLL